MLIYFLTENADFQYANSSMISKFNMFLHTEQHLLFDLLQNIICFVLITFVSFIVTPR